MSKFRYVAVPFEAVARLHELTAKAALLYVHYCQWRNEESGLAWPSLSLIAQTMHIPKTSACELRQQLVERLWLEMLGGDTVRLLVGFSPEPENERSEKSNAIRKSRTSFGKVERHSEKSNDERSEKSNAIRKSRTPFGKVERHSEKSNDERSEKSNEAFGKVERRSEKSNGAFGKVELHIKKNNTMEQHQRTTPPTHPPRTTPQAPDGAAAGAAAVSATPVYSWAICLDYAQHLHDSGQGVKDPAGLAAAIYDGRLAERHNPAITAWLRAREQAAAQAADAAAAASLEAARAAHLAKHQPDYFNTYLWPAVERFLLSEHPDVPVLRQELQSWENLGPRLACMKFVEAEKFFDARPALAVLTFWAWDRQHNPQPFRW